MPRSSNSGGLGIISLPSDEIKIIEQYGNSGLLNLHKTAFLCSRDIPASAVLKCYDWAIAQREAGTCVISGFHSKLEKDVLVYLLKGKQPIIVALARGMKKRIEPALKTALDQGRLLILTPFELKIKRVTAEQAIIRNRLMANLAQEVVVGFSRPGGNLNRLLSQLDTGKSIHFL